MLIAEGLQTSMGLLGRALGSLDSRPFDQGAPPIGGTMGNLASGYTGWGSPLGDVPRGFGALEHYVQQGTNASGPPSLCRLRVFQEAGGALGDLVVDRYFALRPDTTASLRRMEFGRTLPAGRYYAQVNHDVSVGVMRNNPHTTWNVPTYAGYSRLGNTNLAITTFEFPGGAQNSEYFRSMPSPVSAFTTSGAPTGTFSAALSNTFTGWKSPVGSLTGNCFLAALAYTHIEARPTQFRLLCYRAGELVAETTTTPDWSGVEAFRFIPVTWELPGIVTGVDTVAILSDGRYAFRKIADNTYPAAEFGATEYLTNSNVLASNWSTSSTQYNLWIEAETRATTTTGQGSALDFRTQFASTTARTLGPRLVMPSNYFLTSGIEFGLMFDHLVISPDGAWAPDIYDFRVTCAIGSQQRERFVVTATEAPGAGTYPITIEVWYLGVLCDTRTATLNVAAANAGGAASRKYLAIGDSLTDQGAILTEIVRYSAADAFLDVTLVGNYVTPNVPDSTNTNRTFSHAGSSGKDFPWFYSNAASPFVFAGAFNFASYLSAQAITLSAGDTVGIRLGINDVLDRTTDAAVLVKLGGVRTALDGMITSIRASVSGIRIAIQIPSLPVFSQDAAGEDYGTANQRFRVRRNMQLLRQYLIDTYDTGAQRTNLVFVTDDAAGWDNVNNIRLATSAAVNSRSSVSAQRARDLVHPGGYGPDEGGGAFQIADSLWAFFKNKA